MNIVNYGCDSYKNPTIFPSFHFKSLYLQQFYQIFQTGDVIGLWEYPYRKLVPTSGILTGCILTITLKRRNSISFIHTRHWAGLNAICSAWRGESQNRYFRQRCLFVWGVAGCPRAWNDTLLSCLHGGGPKGKARQELQEDGRGSEWWIWLEHPGALQHEWNAQVWLAFLLKNKGILQIARGKDCRRSTYFLCIWPKAHWLHL